MRIVFATLFTLFSYTLFSCACDPISFCWTNYYQPNHNVIIGTIIGTSQNSIIVRVDEVIRGNESRDTIVIWDNTKDTSQCQLRNKTSDMGNIGNKFIAIIPIIDSIQNNWDVIGDYRKPYAFCYTNWLAIRNDSVYGYVNGDLFKPRNSNEYWTSKMPFSEFINWLKSNNGCTLVGQQEYSNIPEFTFLMLNQNTIQILNNSGISGTLRIFSQDGKALIKRDFNSNIYINIGSLQEGLYIVQIQGENGELMTRKFIR